MSTIASGAGEAVLTRLTTWSCYISTVIGISMCKEVSESVAIEDLQTGCLGCFQICSRTHWFINIKRQVNTTVFRERFN
jgi:hypothetical protein